MQRYLFRVSVYVVMLALFSAVPAIDVSLADDAGSSQSASSEDYYDAATSKLTAGSAPDDRRQEAAQFKELWAGATDREPDLGPYAGILEHLPNEVSVADPGMSVSDFAAHIDCLLPEDLNPNFHWDCGFEFRGIADQPHYRLVVTSLGYWAFLVDQTEELAVGEGLAPMEENRLTIDLVAIGNEARFAVNGEYVATLDIAGISGPGTVAAATSFYKDTAIPGGSVRYEQFSVWSLDPLVKSHLQEVSENTFTSPAHGFRLTWDDSWFVSAEILDADEELALVSERATALISTSSGAFTSATDCFTGIIEKYQSDPAYSNVAIFENGRGERVMMPGDDVATALLRYDYTVNDGQLTTEAFDYVLCVLMPDQETIVQLEQFVPADGFIAEMGEMEALQASLQIVEGQFITPPGLPVFTRGAAPPSDIDIATFEQLAAENARTHPSSLAPGHIELAMTGPEFAVWNAGVSVSDFALHAEVFSTGSLGEWQMSIDFRSADSMSQYLSISSDATFSTFDVEGTLDVTPSTIDLIVAGEEGYVALDGQLVAVLDLAEWLWAGDIVFSAVSSDQPLDSTSTLTLENLEIHELGGGISLHIPPPSTTATL